MGPRNNFAQVLSITTRGNLFFWNNAMIFGRNFLDRFQLKTFFFFFFFFREHPDFETKISVFSRLRRANSNFEKWPTRVEKLDHPDLDFVFAAREAFSNLNAALHALSLKPTVLVCFKKFDIFSSLISSLTFVQDR